MTDFNFCIFDISHFLFENADEENLCDSQHWVDKDTEFCGVLGERSGIQKEAFSPSTPPQKCLLDGRGAMSASNVGSTVGPYCCCNFLNTTIGAYAHFALWCNWTGRAAGLFLVLSASTTGCESWMSSRRGPTVWKDSDYYPVSLPIAADFTLSLSLAVNTLYLQSGILGKSQSHMLGGVHFSYSLSCSLQLKQI